MISNIDIEVRLEVGSKYFDNKYIGTVCKSYRLTDIEKSVYGERPVWVMECECGRQIRVSPSLVIGNKIQRCDCGAKGRVDNQNNIETYKDITPQTRDRLKSLLRSLINRCYNESSVQYERYGKVGIGVYTGWVTEPNKFIEWSLNNGYTPIKKLYRRINEDGYNPKNCYWAISKNDIQEEFDDSPMYDLDSIENYSEVDTSSLIRQAVELGCVDDKIRLSTGIGEIDEEKLEGIIDIIKGIKTNKPDNKAIKLKKKIISKLLRIQADVVELEKMGKAAYLLGENEKDNTIIFNRIAGDISLAIRELEEE